ncbi:MAG: helix-turn-helix domain-containing protein [Candidatus Omnitrophica bacterium]|nr:helix-turn-helix domain-containing protein [Candidatus Omnitrophota bacterium]MBU1091141.1 helix-turn-helix domain-containing protein [Candidatus Omnitrophota bacterium]MBU1906180.1 helix-turn-helix domain-containing protein [Candidatus Omnitrophota bacterium]
MGEEKLLTVREVASILGLSEKEIMDLAESGDLPAYKIGGVYLRFRKGQVEEFRRSYKNFLPQIDAKSSNSFKDNVSDFFYFNDFYIFSFLIIILLLIFIFQG